jgi:hypothetical protein
MTLFFEVFLAVLMALLVYRLITGDFHNDWAEVRETTVALLKGVALADRIVSLLFLLLNCLF